MMDRTVFTSIFAEEINKYLDYNISSGYKENSFYFCLKGFDLFCQELGIEELAFTPEDAGTWVRKKDTEATTTHYSRVNAIKHFLIYLARQGYDVFVTRDVRFKPTDFQPHIYSNQEV